MSRTRTALVRLFSLVLLVSSLLVRTQSHAQPAEDDGSTALAAPSFDGPPHEDSKEGYATISWSAAQTATNPLTFVVESSATPDFAQTTLQYEGADLATVVSGLPSGDYHYRVRARTPAGTQSAWSEAKVLQVRHHHLGFTFALFGLGAVVFMATAGFIVVMSRRRDEDL